MPPVLMDFKGESVEVVSPVLKIMRELQVIYGEPVSSQSMEQLMLGSLQASEVALVPLPPTEEPCRACDSLPLGVVEHGVLDVAAPPSLVASGWVIPVSDVTIDPCPMAPTPLLDDPFTKELCDLLAHVKVARPGLGRSIASLLMGTKIEGKCEKLGKGKNNGAIENMYVAT
ncbi:High affinity cationic amino acid transporter 1 [Hordeum vulgare]|nr:High affinity cationic amino acid transporter 1 [Hordeum vulgare]